MGRKIEALWDCDYCGTKKIGGLTKHCPKCGHPQDKDIKFYLPGNIEKNVLDKETADQYGKGADWMCSYCNSLNRYYDETCQNCGAERTEQLGDYFSNKEEPEKVIVPNKPKPAQKKKTAARKDAVPDQKNNKNTPGRSGKQTSFYEFQKQHEQKKAQRKKFLSKFIPGMAAVLALILLFVFIPKNTSATLDHKEWNRSIAIEEYTTLQESDWEVPVGGRVYDQQEEIHHYDRVIDHYETVSVAHTREVLDGYDTSYEYVNNGDGTYDEVEVSTPRYRTETYYEDEEQPVYVDVPVYQTKYYYEIDRWIESRSVDTEGQEEEPYWGDVTLSAKEREGDRSEDYWLIFTTSKGKIYSANLSQDSWEEYQSGDSYKITVQGGLITKINGQEYK